MRKKNKLVLGLVVGIAVFAAAFGMANTLGGITANTLGADDAAVGTCDSNGVSTSYTTSYTTTGTAGYKVGNVTVSGIDNLCDEKSVKVTLTGTGGASLGEITGTVTDDDAITTQDFNFAASNVLAESVLGVHVVISGTPATP